MIIGFEIEKRSLPLYILPLSYLILAMIFPDRWKYASGLILALVLFLGSYGLGKRLSYILFKIADQTLYFPLGLGSRSGGGLCDCGIHDSTAVVLSDLGCFSRRGGI